MSFHPYHRPQAVLLADNTNKGALSTPPLIPILSLPTEIELLDNAPVSLNVNLLQIIEETPSLTYKPQKSTLCVVVFLVQLHVLGKVSDTVGK